MKDNNKAIHDHVLDHVEYLADMDAKYPNRHKEIHKKACTHCPSMRLPVDLEAQEIKDSVSKEAYVSEYAFVCAWRPSKLCKGACDFMGIDQKLVDQVFKNK